MAQTVFSWASVAKGKPQLTADIEAEKAAIKEKARIEKAERARLAWEADAPVRGRQEASVRAKLAKEHEQALMREKYQAEHDQKFSKEGGWLPGQWPTSHEVPYEPRLTVPKHVNERARDWAERALASWWPEWEKCATVEALRTAFIQAFVPYALEHGNYRRSEDFQHWEKNKGLAKGTNEERYANMLRWVKEVESDQPYWHPFWVAVKNITFENCLWAMNVEANTFRAMDKLCPDLKLQITGFLQVEGPAVTWLADFTKYIPYKHDPKPKSKQAIEAKRQRDEEQFDRMIYDCSM
jgi:hypothetical protein